MEKDIRKLAKQEFELILKEYILPLFDIKGSLKCIDEPVVNKELISIQTKDTNVSIAKFYPCISSSKKPSLFHYSIEIHSSSALKNVQYVF